MAFDPEDNHFSFPFTSGEYPAARYGHAACSFQTENLKKKVIIIGGIDAEYCTMDIYTLVTKKRSVGQYWEKIISKTPSEELVSQKASKFVYDSRKHMVELHDLRIQEKAKGLGIKKEEEKAIDEFNKVQEACNKIEEEKKSEIESLDLRTKEQTEKMVSMMMLIKLEELLAQNLEKKSIVLEDYFKDMQSYMKVCVKVFSKMDESKLFSNRNKESRRGK